MAEIKLVAIIGQAPGRAEAFALFKASPRSSDSSLCLFGSKNRASDAVFAAHWANNVHAVKHGRLFRHETAGLAHP